MWCNAWYNFPFSILHDKIEIVIRLHSLTATKLNWAISAFSINWRAELDGLLSSKNVESDYLILIDRDVFVF